MSPTHPESSTEIAQKTLISLGGNALTGEPGKETIQDQQAAAREACEVVGEVFIAMNDQHDNPQLSLVHGNGPQSGFIDRRNVADLQLAELTKGSPTPHKPLHTVPLDAIVADTQGAIGYMLMQGLDQALRNAKHPDLARRLATLVTRVLVDPGDPAFKNPTKPIGQWMTEEEARKREREEGCKVKLMNPTVPNGWRKVVASPSPVSIIDMDAIKHFVRGGFLTICGGGGGIPVKRIPQGGFEGVEAVIDKDSTSTRIAEAVEADLLAILTAVQGVSDPEAFARLRSEAPIIPVIRVKEGRDMLDRMQKGSMGPKLAACLDFTESTGNPSLITDFEHGSAAIIRGVGGTRILPSNGVDEV